MINLNRKGAQAGGERARLKLKFGRRTLQCSPLDVVYAGIRHFSCCALKGSELSSRKGGAGKVCKVCELCQL